MNREVGRWTAAGLLFVIVAVGTAVRFAFVRTAGYPGDVVIFASWLTAATNATPSDLYVRAPDFGYPPASAALFLIIAAIVRHAGGTFSNIETVREAIKIPSIVADAVCVLIAFDIVRRLSNRFEGLAAAAVTAFNPASIYISGFWGQIDGIPAALTLAAVQQITFGSSTLAWPLLALAVLVKPQVVLLAPIFAIAAFRAIEGGIDRRRVVANAIGIVVAAVLCEAFALAFFPHRSPVAAAIAMLKLIHSESSLFAYTSLNAFNFWALFSDFFSSDRVRVLFVSLHVWGALLFAGFALATCVRFARVRTRASFLQACALVMFALFCFYTEIHERYVYFTLPLLVLSFYDRRYALGFGVLALTTMLNLEYALTALTLVDAKVTAVNVNEFAPLLVHACSAVNVGLFLWLFAGYMGYAVTFKATAVDFGTSARSRNVG